MKFRFGYFLVFALTSCLLLASCKITKHVPDGSYLLNHISIKSDGSVDFKEAEAKKFLAQKPNQGIFGKYRLSLKLYSLSGADTSKWINRFLRKLGEPPIIYDESQTVLSVSNLCRMAQNKGYLNASVTVDTIIKKKKINLNFHIKGNPYKIRNFNFAIKDDTLRSYFEKDSSVWKIKSGSNFNLDSLELDRENMVTALRNQGFYYLNKDHFFIVADTALDSHIVDVTVHSRPMLKSDSSGIINEYSHKRIKIGDVRVMAWYDANRPFSEQVKDSIQMKGISFLYEKKMKLRASVLEPKIYLIPGEYYNEENVQKTHNALNGLGITKYVNIRFRASNDSTIDCMIILSPTKIQAFSVEVEGTNTDGDIGAALKATYSHRNIFRGSEQLSVKVRGAYLPMGKFSELLTNKSLDIGGEISFLFPQAMVPFLSSRVRKKIKASTEVSASYSYQVNPWFTRTIATTTLQYFWITGRYNNERYSISPVKLSYVYLPYITESFKKTYMNASSLSRYSYEDHIILAANFTFSKTNKKPNQLRNFYTYKGEIETAGNFLQGICVIAGIEKENGAYNLSKIRFSQYAKGQFEYTFNHVLNERNQLVYHGLIGIAYPYGNAEVVPFEKRFYAGGSNSTRGWSIRTLGPGTFKNTSSRTNFYQSGDIKLDLNLEYRFKLFWVLEGALFFDAGNVWTIKDYPDQVGGQFKFNTFYKQIACSYGLGLRFDFSFFLLRFDVGAKLYDPSSEEGEYWRKPNHLDEYAFHIAIGYPF